MRDPAGLLRGLLRRHLVDAPPHRPRAHRVLRHHLGELCEVEPAAPVEVELVQQHLRLCLRYGDAAQLLQGRDDLG